MVRSVSRAGIPTRLAGRPSLPGQNPSPREVGPTGAALSTSTATSNSAAASAVTATTPIQPAQLSTEQTSNTSYSITYNNPTTGPAEFGALGHIIGSGTQTTYQEETVATVTNGKVTAQNVIVNRDIFGTIQGKGHYLGTLKYKPVVTNNQLSLEYVGFSRASAYINSTVAVTEPNGKVVNVGYSYPVNTTYNASTGSVGIQAIPETFANNSVKVYQKPQPITENGQNLFFNTTLSFSPNGPTANSAVLGFNIGGKLTTTEYVTNTQTGVTRGYSLVGSTIQNTYVSYPIKSVNIGGKTIQLKSPLMVVNNNGKFSFAGGSSTASEASASGSYNFSLSATGSLTGSFTSKTIAKPATLSNPSAKPQTQSALFRNAPSSIIGDYTKASTTALPSTAVKQFNPSAIDIFSSDVQNIVTGALGKQSSYTVTGLGPLNKPLTTIGQEYAYPVLAGIVGFGASAPAALEAGSQYSATNPNLTLSQKANTAGTFFGTVLIAPALDVASTAKLTITHPAEGAKSIFTQAVPFLALSGMGGEVESPSFFDTPRDVVVQTAEASNPTTITERGYDINSPYGVAKGTEGALLTKSETISRTTFKVGIANHFILETAPAESSSLVLGDEALSYSESTTTSLYKKGFFRTKLISESETEGSTTITQRAELAKGSLVLNGKFEPTNPSLISFATFKGTPTEITPATDTSGIINGLPRRMLNIEDVNKPIVESTVATPEAVGIGRIDEVNINGKQVSLFTGKAYAKGVLGPIKIVGVSYDTAQEAVSFLALPAPKSSAFDLMAHSPNYGLGGSFEVGKYSLNYGLNSAPTLSPTTPIISKSSTIKTFSGRGDTTTLQVMKPTSQKPTSYKTKYNIVSVTEDQYFEVVPPNTRSGTIKEPKFGLSNANRFSTHNIPKVSVKTETRFNFASFFKNSPITNQSYKSKQNNTKTAKPKVKMTTFNKIGFGFSTKNKLASLTTNAQTTGSKTVTKSQTITRQLNGTPTIVPFVNPNEKRFSLNGGIPLQSIRVSSASPAKKNPIFKYVSDLFHAEQHIKGRKTLSGLSRPIT